MQTSSVQQRKSRRDPDEAREEDYDEFEEGSSRRDEPTEEDLSAEHISRDIEENMSFNRYDDLQDYLLFLRPWAMIREKSEWVRLFRKYHSDNADDRHEAMCELVYRNHKLVLSIGLKHSGRGLGLLDCLQEGMIGLMTAIEKYEMEKGFAFSTYATWWIRQAITRAISDLNTDRAFRLPVHYQESVATVKKALSKYMKEHGEWPNNYQVFKAIRASNSVSGAKMTLAQVAKIMDFIRYDKPLSLSTPVEMEDDGSQTVQDRIQDPKAKTETIVEASKLLPRYEEALGRIERAVEALPPRYGMVLRLRFGFGEFDPMSLEEVGQRYEVTRERIRQLETDAFAQLETAGIKISANEIEKLMDIIDELKRIVEASR